MRRVISAFRLLAPIQRDLGPLQVTADAGVPPDGIGLLLNGVYIAVEKLRKFGLPDAGFSGRLHILHREPGEKAHGRYLPGSDRAFVFFPHERGVEDWLWTILHELAHRIWHRVLTDAERALWTRAVEGLGVPYTPEAADSYTRLAVANPDRYPLWFFFQKHFGDDPAEFKKWLLTRRYSEDLPTDYSSANGAEAFSDTFAELILGRAHSGCGLRRTGAFPKKTLLSILSPYRSRKLGESADDQEDDQFLQSQVDLPSLQGPIAQWVGKNLDESEIKELERRAHTTLVYGLDRRDYAQIQSTAAEFGRPIRLMVGALNFFDAPEHDVLYFEVLGSSLHELRQPLMKLPHTRPQTHSSYVPHITVAYLKKGAARRFKGQQPLKQVITRNGFTLIDGTGIEVPIPTVPETAQAFDPVLLADVSRSNGSSG